MIKVIYLCPEIPIPTTSGGKVAFLNHLEEVADGADVSLKVIMVDVDGDRDNCADQLNKIIGEVHVFKRNIPRIGSGVNGKIRAIVQTLCSKYPRAYFARQNKNIHSLLLSMLEKREIDVIVADHLTSMAMIPREILTEDIPIILIEHNVECEILRQQMKGRSFFDAIKLYYYYEYLRTKFIERKALRNASNIVCISSYDVTGLKEAYSSLNLDDKLTHCAELLPFKYNRWSYRTDKKILFIGSPKYFPNRDAILWLVNELAPELAKKDSDIRIVLAGCEYSSELMLNGIKAENVEFLGFVTERELQRLYCESSLFICPIVLGSGVKIKLLEAVAYGIPLLSTEEGAKGIDFIPDELLFDRRNVLDCANIIMNLVNSEDLLREISKNIEDGAQKALELRKNKLLALVKDVACVQ